jgi:hypothetical protein
MLWKTLSVEFFTAYIHKMDRNWTQNGLDWADKGYYRPSFDASDLASQLDKSSS